MKVLLGVGGTEDSFLAIERTIERAAEAGDHLTVAVLENPASEATPATIEDRIRETLANSPLSVGEGTGEGTATIRHLSGEPGPRLVELAEREGFDRLVLGGGERSPMGKIVPGPIAEYVLVNARVTVTLIR